MNINGKKIFVCAFTQGYISDMPQQTENSGFKRFNANHGCRKCTVVQKDLGKLNLNTVELERSHYEMMIQRKKLKRMSKTEAVKFCQEWGLKDKSSPLVQLSPALDIIHTHPLDPAHSELAGLSRGLQ